MLRRRVYPRPGYVQPGPGWFSKRTGSLLKFVFRSCGFWEMYNTLNKQNNKSLIDQELPQK